MKSNAIFQTDSTDDCINLKRKKKKRLKITTTEPVLFTIIFGLHTGKQDHNSSPQMEFWFSPGKALPSLLKHTKPYVTAQIPGVSSVTAACECWHLVVVWACELSSGWPSTNCLLKTRNGKLLNPDLYFLIPRQYFSISNKCQVQSTHLNNGVWGIILFFMFIFNFLYLLLKTKSTENCEFSLWCELLLWSAAIRSEWRNCPRKTKQLCTQSAF